MTSHGAETLEEPMKSTKLLASFSLALLLLAGTGLVLAQDNPTASAQAAARPNAKTLAPFLGVWRTQITTADKKVLPGSEIAVRLREGEPEITITLYQHSETKSGSIRSEKFVMPAYDASVSGRTLTAKVRTAPRYRTGGSLSDREFTVQLALGDNAKAAKVQLVGEQSAVAAHSAVAASRISAQ
jgi:hypothetical protein